MRLLLIISDVPLVGPFLVRGFWAFPGITVLTLWIVNRKTPFWDLQLKNTPEKAWKERKEPLNKHFLQLTNTDGHKYRNVT